MNRSRLPMNQLSKQLGQRFLSPLRTLTQLDEDIHNWLNDSDFSTLGFYDGADFIPQCDLIETSKEYIARMDIPGVKKKELKIEVDGNRLTVSGERKSEREDKTERHFFKESSQGSFLRTFTLPTQVDEAKVNAHFEDGVLTIKIPKSEISKAKQVEIQ